MGVGKKVLKRKVKKTVDTATDELLGIDDHKKRPGKKKNKMRR